MNEIIYNTKKILRKNILKKMKLLSNNDRHIESEKIQKSLMNLPEFINSKNILLYIPLSYECETDEIFKKCDEMKKSVFVPKVLSKTEMDFFEIYNYNDILKFEKSKYGVPEPPDDRKCVTNEKISIDLVILPGVAFDKKCNRLGHGKAFYDNYIKKMKRSDYQKEFTTVALSLNCQFIEEVPIVDSDEKLNYIITPNQNYKS